MFPNRNPCNNSQEPSILIGTQSVPQNWMPKFKVHPDKKNWFKIELTELGGGGVADAPSSRSHSSLPPADPKGLPFEIFWDIHLFYWDPKIFLKCLQRRYTLIWMGKSTPKKNTVLWTKLSKKGLQTLLWSVFFSPALQKTRPKQSASKLAVGNRLKMIIMLIFWQQ